MKAKFLFLAFYSLAFSMCSLDQAHISLSTTNFKIDFDQKGLITSLTDLQTGNNYIDTDSASYLMALRIDNEIIVPQSISQSDETITLKYNQDYEANIKVETKDRYLTFELVSLSKAETVDLVLWGPFLNTIRKTIGETVGVVRNDDFAFGIQSLNIKTLGGYPWNESDRMPAFDFVRAADPNNMHPDADGSVLYRIEAGKPTDNGSSLQAYCRNRNKPRLISDFRHEKIWAPAYEDSGVIGSKIALFGCPEAEVLDLLGALEIAEGLPHPTIDG